MWPQYHDSSCLDQSEVAFQARSAGDAAIGVYGRHNIAITCQAGGRQVFITQIAGGLDVIRRYLPLVLGPGIHAPLALSAPALEYSEAARKANLSGNVVVVLAINERGSVDDAKVVHSSDRRFEQSAIDAIKQWEFAPATKDGKPVALQMNVEMSFEIDVSALFTDPTTGA